eukprot:GHVL01037397.1.p1 GENE.GHVL01037397.1~~GHVL01037397.1.p1  ORF type:complete len:328 (-),score=65.88 GHVL01037397.1:211-1065(-)
MCLANCTESEISYCLSEAYKSVAPTPMSALSLLNNVVSVYFDGFINNIICRTIGVIHETVGPPGVGKTQLSLEIAAQIGICSTIGDENENLTFWLDSEGSFNAERLFELMNVFAAKRGLSSETVSKAMSRVRVIETQTLTSVLDVLKDIKEEYINHTQALLVVDSVAAAAGREIDLLNPDHTLERQKKLYLLSKKLKYLSTKMKMLVLTTNQVRCSSDNTEENDWLPALGIMWHHLVSVRLVLDYTHDFIEEKQIPICSLQIQKSPLVAPTVITYYIYLAVILF